MSELTFESVWEEFQSKVRTYSTKQKRQILLATSNAFQHILSSMPAPRQDGADETPLSPSNKKLLSDIEALISDRMHQSGEDKSLFLRYDRASSGVISVDQFTACIASLGIALTPSESEALVKKYDSTGSGQINYMDFWKYLQANLESPRTTHQATFNPSALNRPPAMGKDYSALVRTIPESLEERMARGLKTLRETMYQRSSNLHGLFLSLQNNAHQVSVEDILPQLNKLGFPANLVSDDDLRQVALRHSIKNPGFFTYAEFLAFFTGHESVLSPVGEPQGVLDSPALMNALVKVNNINLRKFFKDLDDDADGLITSAHCARGSLRRAASTRSSRATRRSSSTWTRSPSASRATSATPSSSSSSTRARWATRARSMDSPCAARWRSRACRRSTTPRSAWS